MYKWCCRCVLQDYLLQPRWFEASPTIASRATAAAIRPATGLPQGERGPSSRGGPSEGLGGAKLLEFLRRLPIFAAAVEREGMFCDLRVSVIRLTVLRSDLATAISTSRLYADASCPSLC